MRRFFNYLILATAVHAAAQITPPPMAAFTYSAGSWAAAASSAMGGAINYQPPAAALYCYNSTLSKWVPADSSCFGGGGILGIDANGTPVTPSSGIINFAAGTNITPASGYDTIATTSTGATAFSALTTGN